MRRLLDLPDLRQKLAKGLTGPQMLAFLPALCLSAYWIGGEVPLVLCALATPLVYAVFGGFGGWTSAAQTDAARAPDVNRVAQDFLEIAQHSGQTTACFKITIPELDQIAHRFGANIAGESRDLIAARLRTSLRASDYVFRSEGTQFTVLISPGFRLRLDNLIDLGKRLREAAETPLVLDGTTHTLTACIGIASSLNFGRNVTANVWLQSATDAMDEAVMAGASTTRLWSDRLARRNRSRHALRQDIETALDEGAIQAYFQPQISVRTGEVSGMEAFARWLHPTRGVLPAAEFLPAATDSRQMVRLGRSIFLQAVTALHHWDESGFNVGTMSVNLSEEELRDPELPGRIASDLDRCGIPAHRLVFDIPETLLNKAADDMIRRNLVSLAGLGCGLDLEGFGLGGCSITVVQQLPVTRLKLDKSLVHGAAASEDRTRTLHAVLAISERLELPAVAAGVETIEDDSLLRDLGCAHAQGFLYAPPSSAADTKIWLESRQALKTPRTGAKIRHIR